MLRLAVERLLEIMGQAAKEVTTEFTGRYPDLPWLKIVGLRNVLAHEYGEIKDEKIYFVVTRDLPLLIEQLKHILEENNESI